MYSEIRAQVVTRQLNDQTQCFFVLTGVKVGTAALQMSEVCKPAVNLHIIRISNHPAKILYRLVNEILAKGYDCFAVLQKACFSKVNAFKTDNYLLHFNA